MGPSTRPSDPSFAFASAFEHFPLIYHSVLGSSHLVLNHSRAYRKPGKLISETSNFSDVVLCLGRDGRSGADFPRLSSLTSAFEHREFGANPSLIGNGGSRRQI